uniref:Uncharacterized protein n=1 Tax=Anguilla anguilla TaxID=7936 RepID=A0A0E9Q4U7_ANGAN
MAAAPRPRLISPPYSARQTDSGGVRLMEHIKVCDWLFGKLLNWNHW